MSSLGILSNEEICNEYVLCKIIRYNHRCRLQDESVAEHSFYVSLFCLKILSKLNLDKETERKILIKAILHDTGESLTSDIPHDVKANYPEMRKILNQIENDYYDKNWKSYQEELSEDDKLVDIIIKLADSYSVYQYCLNEKKLGNKSPEIISILQDAVSRIYDYTDDLNKIIGGSNKNE